MLPEILDIKTQLEVYCTYSIDFMYVLCTSRWTVLDLTYQKTKHHGIVHLSRFYAHHLVYVNIYCRVGIVLYSICNSQYLYAFKFVMHSHV